MNHYPAGPQPRRRPIGNITPAGLAGVIYPSNSLYRAAMVWRGSAGLAY